MRDQFAHIPLAFQQQDQQTEAGWVADTGTIVTPYPGSIALPLSTSAAYTLKEHQNSHAGA